MSKFSTFRNFAVMYSVAVVVAKNSSEKQIDTENKTARRRFVGICEVIIQRPAIEAWELGRGRTHPKPINRSFNNQSVCIRGTSDIPYSLDLGSTSLFQPL